MQVRKQTWSKNADTRCTADKLPHCYSATRQDRVTAGNEKETSRQSDWRRVSMVEWGLCVCVCLCVCSLVLVSFVCSVEFTYISWTGAAHFAQSEYAHSLLEVPHGAAFARTRGRPLRLAPAADVELFDASIASGLVALVAVRDGAGSLAAVAKDTNDLDGAAARFGVHGDYNMFWCREVGIDGSVLSEEKKKGRRCRYGQTGGWVRGGKEGRGRMWREAGDQWPKRK